VIKVEFPASLLQSSVSQTFLIMISYENSDLYFSGNHDTLFSGSFDK